MHSCNERRNLLRALCQKIDELDACRKVRSAAPRAPRGGAEYRAAIIGLKKARAETSLAYQRYIEHCKACPCRKVSRKVRWKPRGAAMMDLHAFGR